MKKLVLGIIVVLCLQFVFVHYIALRSPIELAVAPIATISRADDPDLRLIDAPNDPTVNIPKLDVTAPSASSPRNAEKRSPQSAPANVENAGRRKVRHENDHVFRTGPRRVAAGRQISSNTETAGNFESVVIRYDRSPAIADCEKYYIPKTKKRSFMAKAMPVIKKPWELIKSIGSKLD